jgi:hypothetical protein
MRRPTHLVTHHTLAPLHLSAGAAPLRPVPPLRFALTRIAPIVASTAATMFFGNAAYLTLSVAFIQVGIWTIQYPYSPRQSGHARTES